MGSDTKLTNEHCCKKFLRSDLEKIVKPSKTSEEKMKSPPFSGSGRFFLKVWHPLQLLPRPFIDLYRVRLVYPLIWSLMVNHRHGMRSSVTYIRIRGNFRQASLSCLKLPQNRPKIVGNFRQPYLYNTT